MGTAHWAFYFSSALGNTMQCVKNAKRALYTELPPCPVLDNTLMEPSEETKLLESSKSRNLWKPFHPADYFLNHEAWPFLVVPVSSAERLYVTRMFYRYHDPVSGWQPSHSCRSTLPGLRKAFLWLWRSPSAHSLAGDSFTELLTKPSCTPV